MGKNTISSVFIFNKCEVDFGKEAIELYIWYSIEKLNTVELTGERRKQKDDRATESEESAYRELAGTRMYMGNYVIKQAELVTSGCSRNWET